MELIGIDGCKAGWLLATGDESLGSLDFSVESSLAPVFGRARRGITLVVIDIPIGLADRGPRACDVAARAFLGAPRGSSVFPAPCRATLAAGTPRADRAGDAQRLYQEACRLNFEASGKRISQQLFWILDKIGEVDRLMTPRLQQRVREAHPEVTFAALAGSGRGLAHNKRRSPGKAERLALLQDRVPRFDPARVRAHLGRSNLGADDLIDAVACLVTAGRIATGRATVLSRGEIPVDSTGLRMEIVA